MTTMRTLYCQNGQHYWERPSQRGRQPLHCPDHQLPGTEVTGTVEELRRGEAKPVESVSLSTKARDAISGIEEKARKAVAPEADETITLWCELGQHEWERPRRKGAKPKNCPEHQPTPVEREATISPRRSAESSPLWDYISKLKDEYHCTCDIHPGMTLADLRQVKSCQPGWICNVLDAYRRRLGS